MATLNQITARKLRAELMDASMQDAQSYRRAVPYRRRRPSQVEAQHHARLMASVEALEDVKSGHIKGAKADKVIKRSRRLLKGVRLREQGGRTPIEPLKKGRCAFVKSGACMCKSANGKVKIAKAHRCKR
jgi:hypothetical protein